MTGIPKIVSIQDMSAMGRCSLTVMIPIVSALGCQAVPLPTAIFSNHLEFPHYSMVDITDHLLSLMEAWQKNHFSFQAIQSGFLASPQQIELVRYCIHHFGQNKLIVVDPAMADHGKLYSIYNDDMVRSMKELIQDATLVKPNYTEACFLLGEPYSEDEPSEVTIRRLCQNLSKLGPSYVALTSIPHPTKAKVAFYDKHNDDLTFFSSPLVPVKAHGTGDTFTATATALLLRGHTPATAVAQAAQFTSYAVDYTHRTYGDLREGIALEELLPHLMSYLSPQLP